MPRWKARTWWILGLLLLLQLAVAVGFCKHAIRRDLERWEDYQAHCRSIGEDLGIEAWLPAPVAPEDNVFNHPWITGFLVSESSPQAQAVGELQPWPGLGLDGHEEPADGKSWFDGREAEASAVAQAGRDRAGHFKAIHEATARTGCRPPLDFSGSYETLSGPWSRVAEFRPMLAIHAEAAMLSGDISAATADLEAMLRLGKHLRGQNFLIATLIGMAFDSRAKPIIDLGLTRNLFQAGDRRRLLAAMRTRPVHDEMAAVMRVERGMFLASLEDEIEKAQPAGFDAKLEAWLNPPARRIATNSYHFCKLLEPTLANSASRSSWEDLDRAIRRMSKEEPTPANGIAKTIYVLIGEFGPCFEQEDELDALRQRLAE
jgi:hypothetical protein